MNLGYYKLLIEINSKQRWLCVAGGEYQFRFGVEEIIYRDSTVIGGCFSKKRLYRTVQQWRK